jgi:hypothetical protein
MKEDQDDFSLTPVNIPLDLQEVWRMKMALFTVPARITKIKRLVETLYVKRKKVDKD